MGSRGRSPSHCNLELGAWSLELPWTLDIGHWTFSSRTAHARQLGGRPLHLLVLDRLVDFLGDGAAGEAAGFSALDHHDDYVTRIVIRSVGCEPRGVIDDVVVEIGDLRGAGLAA